VLKNVQIIQVLIFFSVEEASNKCHLPDWLQKQKVWSSLDSAISLRLLSTQGFLLENLLDSVHPERSQISCQKVVEQNQNSVLQVNYVKSDCDSGFVCTLFTKKSPRVMTLEFGQKSTSPEEACSDLYFNQYVTKTVLLVSESLGEPGECPLSGSFSLNPLSSQESSVLTDCHSPKALNLEAECGASELSIDWKCPGRRSFAKKRFFCMSSWNSRDRTHLVLYSKENETKLCLTFKDGVLSVSEHNCAGSEPHYNVSRTGPCVSKVHSAPLSASASEQTVLSIVALIVGLAQLWLR
jgi:hypothetical protein